MGIALGIGNTRIGSSGISWSAYWWMTRYPSGLTAVGSENSVTLNWTNNGGSDYALSVEKCTDWTTFIEDSVTAEGATSKTITGLTQGTVYFFRVRGVKNGRYSAYSNIASTLVDESWFLAGGIPAVNAKAAYTAIAAASLAASYVNKANPGTDITTTNAPALDAAKGWDFDGAANFLKTGIVPENDQTWSMFIRYADYTTGTVTIAGCYNAAAAAFYIQRKNNSGGTTAQNGGILVTTHPAQLSGLTMINGDKLVVEGVVQSEGSFAAPSGNITAEIYIGALNNGGSAAQFFMGCVGLLSVYDFKLSDLQKKRLEDRARAIDVVNDKKAIDYLLWKISAMICWNMPTFTADEICNGDLDPDTFAPTGYDMDQWLDAIKSAKIPRAILTVKAHDGFMLWPSEQCATDHLPYTVARTAWYAANGNPDVVEDFVNGCRERGIRPCLYFSIWDKTHEARTGTDETTDAAGYIAMAEAQLTELLSNYGTIDAIWLDGWVWHMGYEEITFATIYNFIKGIQPNCVVIDNRGIVSNPGVSDVEVYENTSGRFIAADNAYPAEDCDTLRTDGKWYYHNGLAVTEDSFDAAASVKTAMDQSLARYGCKNIAIQPGKDGVLPQGMVNVLEDLGALL